MMTDRPGRSLSHLSPVLRAMLFGVSALGLVALPLSSGSGPLDVDWKVAEAKKGGNGGGRGGDRGGGRSDRSERSEKSVGDGGRGKGAGNGKGNGGHRGRGFDWSGGEQRLDKAKGRYEKAGGGNRRGGRGSGRVGLDEAGEEVYGFSRRESLDLIERGWQGKRSDDGFRNHGERVRTMVELAKRLGHTGSVGALQANFGTPQENGVADIQAELEAARAAAGEDPEAAARVEELEVALADALAGAKPGNASTDWAEANLDVNGDGAVNAADLAALDNTDPDASDGVIGGDTAGGDTAGDETAGDEVADGSEVVDGGAEGPPPLSN
ncbi:MAG: hypothetical protein OEU92_11600 [Alphaproteobacteria bacterium]|nr:hypothetical protein [Alphaproteobacteria bacterium]